MPQHCGYYQLAVECGVTAGYVYSLWTFNNHQSEPISRLPTYVLVTTIKLVSTIYDMSIIIGLWFEKCTHHCICQNHVSYKSNCTLDKSILRWSNNWLQFRELLIVNQQRYFGCEYFSVLFSPLFVIQSPPQYQIFLYSCSADRRLVCRFTPPRPHVSRANYQAPAPAQGILLSCWNEIRRNICSVGIMDKNQGSSIAFYVIKE